jgi:hypothetical protein
MNTNSKVIAVVLAVGVLLALWYALDSNSPMVSAQGEASLKVQPDEVSVYVTIESHNTTAEAAQTTVSSASKAVVSALRNAGVPNSSIQLQQYSIYPDYSWDSVTGRQTQKGYVATQSIIVKTSDFMKVAGMVDDVVAAGGLVSSIQFELSQAKQNEYKTQALGDAGKDAQTKAAATAAGLGKSLGRLVSVQTTDFNYPGPIMYYAKDSMTTSVGGMATAEDNAGAIRAAANIAPQDIDVTATLQVQYKVGFF